MSQLISQLLGKVLHITVIVVGYDLSTELKNHSFPETRLYEFSSVFLLRRTHSWSLFRHFRQPLYAQYVESKSHKSVQQFCVEIGFINACGWRQCPSIILCHDAIELQLRHGKHRHKLAIFDSMKVNRAMSSIHQLKNTDHSSAKCLKIYEYHILSSDATVCFSAAIPGVCVLNRMDISRTQLY
jgi:hypothetical protein